jgi:hypothetical protein
MVPVDVARHEVDSQGLTEWRGPGNSLALTLHAALAEDERDTWTRLELLFKYRVLFV